MEHSASPPTSNHASDQHTKTQPHEDLSSELVACPDPPEGPKPIQPPGLDYVLNFALRHIRGKRGGDLLAILLVGSGARRSLTPHSDIDLIAIIKGEEEREEVVRIADRAVEIRYRGYRSVEEDIPYAPRLPPLLRKARILFEHEAAGSKLLDRAAQRFRQGPPQASLNEKIRLKSQCRHWLGKAQDLQGQPAPAHYILGLFLDEIIHSFFLLNGFWLTSPADTIRFIASRDANFGTLLTTFLTTQQLDERLKLGRQIADSLFQEIPNLPRID